jgi:4-phytase/acid phosphatase
MLKYWLVFAALAAAVPNAPYAYAAPDLVTDSAVLLMRHGVRPPTHEPALDPAIAPSPWPAWEVPDGYLTPHGAQAIKRLASYDRIMLASAGLLPATGCPAGVTIYTDVDERTEKTGDAFAAGLAPGCPLAATHADSKTDPLFSPLDGTVPGFDTKAAKAAMLAAAGGSLAAPVTANAALFQKMQNTLDPGGTSFLQLPAKISAKMPGHEPKLTGPIPEGATASEDFLLEYLDDKPMSQVAWGRASAADVAALLALHPLEYTLTARPPYIANRAAGPLARRILASLTGGEKLTVLVGHDTNIADLGGMLKLHWSLGGYPADDPPPGGGLLFMLAHDQATGEKYVTAAYQVQTMDQIRNLTAAPPAAQPLPIPGCGNSTAPTACTLATFTKLIGAAN